MKSKVLFISSIIVAFVAIFAVLLLIPYEISLIIIVLLIGTSIITNLKPNMKFHSDIQEYSSSGYTIERREGSFFTKTFLKTMIRMDLLLVQLEHIFIQSIIQRRKYIFISKCVTVTHSGG